MFSITSATSVYADENAKAEARTLLDALAPAMGFRLERVDGRSCRERRDRVDAGRIAATRTRL